MCAYWLYWGHIVFGVKDKFDFVGVAGLVHKVSAATLGIEDGEVLYVRILLCSSYRLSVQVELNRLNVSSVRYDCETAQSES